MLSLADIQHCLDHLSYRPGWSFIAYDSAFEGPWLRIDCEVENSLQPGSNIDQRIETAIPPCTSSYDFERWLIYRLTRIESFEAREWFKRDGKVLYDPHDGS